MVLFPQKNGNMIQIFYHIVNIMSMIKKIYMDIMWQTALKIIIFLFQMHGMIILWKIYLKTQISLNKLFMEKYQRNQITFILIIKIIMVGLFL